MSVQEAYRDKGYALVEGMVPPEVVESFLVMIQFAVGTTRSTYLGDVAHLKFTKKDTYDFYGPLYHPLVTFHWALTSKIAELTGAAVLPSYAYFRVYQEGDICRVHSDRGACEHSMSLTLAYSDGKPWEFVVGTEDVNPEESSQRMVQEDFGDEPYTTVTMNPGDAILYRGPFRRHGRIVPNPNRWSAHVFLHWVEKGGPYAEYAFEKLQIPPRSEFEF